jgi:hypothetical protein
MTPKPGCLETIPPGYSRWFQLGPRSRSASFQATGTGKLPIRNGRSSIVLGISKIGVTTYSIGAYEGY